MALKLPDSAVPMGDFPVAKAVDIDFNDGENLQEKFDNGELGGGGNAEPQIKDWVSGDSYLEGDYIYHEGEIYRCLTSNSDVDFDETNWKKLTYGIDDTLTTTDKTITGAINEVNGNLLDTVEFSADYKNIILNRKNGLNPYTIPISAIINNASLTELKDIDNTDIGNGKTLIYDAVTGKHKYVESTGTDELVKMDSTGDAHYLVDLLDKQTVINDNGILKVKKLDGQEVTITEINYLKGLTMNVMDLVNAFANGGVKVLNTPLNTASELDTMDRTSFIEGISYIVYVLADENHAGAKTTYLVDKDNTTFFGNADSQRNFTTNPIDLANEVTGKLGTSNIDVDSLWTLLTINDTYKTLTTNNEIFGTHGAKALYDELVTYIGEKANTSDLTTHTGDTDIHVSTTQTDKWDKVTDKLDTVDFNTHKDNTDIHITKEEKDKLVTTDDITGTIDVKRSGAKIPNVRAIYEDIIMGRSIDQKVIDTYGTEILKYPLGIWRISDDAIARKFTDLPDRSSGCIEITSINSNIDKNPWNSTWAYRVYNFETYKDMKYFRKLFSSGTSGVLSDDTGWRRVCTTRVADVDVTTITPINSNITGTIQYTVKNGICYVSLFDVRSKTSDNGFSISTTMPKPAINSSSAIYKQVGSGNIGFVYINKNTTQLTANINTSGILGSCSFSYPVAE